MGSVTDTPTIINNLEVPERLFVAGTAEFTQGTTNDSVKTKLVFSDPADDLDLVGRTGTLGTTGAIKLGTNTIAMYAGAGIPVATVNGDRFSASYVENDVNGLQSQNAYISYSPGVVTINDASGGTSFAGDTLNVGKIWGKFGNMDIATDQGDLGVGHGGLRLAPNTVEIFDGSSATFNASFLGDTLNVGKVWGKFSNMDIAANQGDLGVGHGGTRLAPNAVEFFDGSLNEWNAQLNNNVLAVTTVSGPATDKGGGANILYFKAKQGAVFPDTANAGMRIGDTSVTVYDGTDAQGSVNFTGSSILSKHAAYAFLQESALGSWATGNIVWGPPAGTGTLSAIRTTNTMGFNLAAGNVDGITPLQRGIYHVKALAVGNLINASIQITINGSKAVNSATAGANFLNLCAEWVGELNAGDIVRVFVVTSTVAKDGASFFVERLDGCNTDVTSQGASLGPI